jgi:hypothetical protein
VLACLGDPTNIEILVDTVMINDGADVGYMLSITPSDLWLIMPNGMKVHLYYSP